jgi:hypothetical protein
LTPEPDEEVEVELEAELEAEEVEVPVVAVGFEAATLAARAARERRVEKCMIDR